VEDEYLVRRWKSFEDVRKIVALFNDLLLAIVEDYGRSVVRLKEFEDNIIQNTSSIVPNRHAIYLC
jgi:hypothetical protein